MILSFINKIVFYFKKKRKEKVMHSVRISLNKRGFFDFVVFLICFKPHFFFFFESLLGYFTEYLYVLTKFGYKASASNEISFSHFFIVDQMYMYLKRNSIIC